MDQGIPVDMGPRFVREDCRASSLDGTGLKAVFTVRWQVTDSVRFVTNVHRGDLAVLGVSTNLIQWALAARSTEAALAAAPELGHLLAPAISDSLSRWGCTLLGFEVNGISLTGDRLKLGSIDAR